MTDRKPEDPAAQQAAAQPASDPGPRTPPEAAPDPAAEPAPELSAPSPGDDPTPAQIPAQPPAQPHRNPFVDPPGISPDPVDGAPVGAFNDVPAPARTGRARPRIGVTASSRGGRWMWGLSWLALRLLGTKPVRLQAPQDPDALRGFDGYVIGGGDDIGAELYDGAPAMDVRIDKARDEMEMRVLDHALPRDLPILGICRGAQMLNIHLGGGLHQEVREAYENVPKMWTPLPVKTVTVEKDTRLERIIGRHSFRANSLHHQSIDRLGQGLRLAAKDEYGVVQAVEDPAALFRIGVQWHPEFLLWRGPHRRLFRAFAVAAHQTPVPAKAPAAAQP